ncbi:MAG: hypothetical protein WCF90_10915, partial [Methanomicrobiales archaeon]
TVLPTLTIPVVPPVPIKSAGFPVAAAILSICLIAVIQKKSAMDDHDGINCHFSQSLLAPF